VLHFNNEQNQVLLKFGITLYLSLIFHQFNVSDSCRDSYNVTLPWKCANVISADWFHRN